MNEEECRRYGTEGPLTEEERSILHELKEVYPKLREPFERTVHQGDQRDLVDVFWDFGVAASIQGDPTRSLASFKLALRVLPISLDNDPDRARLHMGYALTLKAIGDLEGAIQEEEAALHLHRRVHLAENPDLDADRAVLHMNYANTLDALGDLNGAKREYQTALACHRRPHLADNPALDVDRAVLHMNYASTLTALGDLNGAMQEFQIALDLHQKPHALDNPALDADRARLHINYAGTLYTIGDLDGAKREYQAALDLHQRPGLADNRGLDTSRAGLHINYAWTLTSLGDLVGFREQTKSAVHQLITMKVRTGVWPDLACRVIRIVEASKQFFWDWIPWLQPLSRSFVDYVDVASETIARHAQPDFARFHAIYLSLCLTRNRIDRIPEVLAAIHGRRLAGMVHAELLGRSGDFSGPHGGQKQEYTKVLNQLRRLQIELQSLSGGLDRAAPDPGDQDQRGTVQEARNRRYRELLREFETCHQEWQRLRDLLAETDPAFTVMSPDWAPSLDRLQSRLAAREAIVLLVDFFQESEGRSASRRLIALVIKARDHAVIDLPSLAQLPPGVMQYRMARGRSSRTRLRDSWPLHRSSVESAVVQASEDPEAILRRLKQHLSEHLWAPLQSELAGVERVHLISHGDFHVLPYELGMPEFELYHYPGLISYVLRHHPKQERPEPGPGQRSVIHGYDAADTEAAAIPFTAVDRGAMEAIWQPDTAPLDEYLAGSPEPAIGIRRVCLSGHGRHDPEDPWASAILIGRDRYLDAAGILDTRPRPSEIQSWACSTGSVTDSPDGEPIGLVTVWLLKQARYVVGAVIPVADFYVPILGCLYNQGLKAGLSPEVALQDAKRRLQSGAWHADTESILAPLYRKVILQCLRELRDAEPRLTADQLREQFNHLLDWPGIDHGDVPTLIDGIQTDEKACAVADRIWNSLTAQRAHLALRPEVRDLLVWVRGFGQPS
jgi:tetratricopeptide (TPR) repeat protein